MEQREREEGMGF